MSDFEREAASCNQIIQKARTDEDFLRIGATIERLRPAPRTNVAAWTHQRRLKLELWLKAIDIDRSIDPTFDPRDVPASNIAPPFETGLDSGVAPSEIKDPKLREQYEKAIKDNDDKSDWYNLQHDLRQLAARWSLVVPIYVRSEYTSKPEDVKEVSDLLDKLLSSSERKKQLKKDFFGAKDAESEKKKPAEQNTAGRKTGHH